jgi:hypothetical protein
MHINTFACVIFTANPIMELVKYFTILSLGSATVAAVGVFVAKALFNKSLDALMEARRYSMDKELEIHRATLSRDTERFKSELDILVMQNQVKFTALHEERGTVLKTIYTSIYQMEQDLEFMTSFGQGPEWITDDTRVEKASAVTGELNGYFERNRIYLEDSICEKIMSTIKLSNSIISRMRQARLKERMNERRRAANQQVPEDQTEQPHRIWEESEERVHSEFNTARLGIAKEFKTLVGVEN